MTSSWRTDLFGPTLASREGPVPTDKALEGAELVAILFGASWCPACQAFFPTLSRFFQSLAEQNPSRLKIVYSTADVQQDTFDTTMSKTTWFAIPFDDKNIRSALAKKYAIAGVPCLLVLDNATGEPKVMNARRTVEDSVDNEEDPLAVFEQWQKMNVHVESGCVACSIL